MGKNRLEAFSDGVIAILITIMVLELKVPTRPDFAALAEVVPRLVTYLISFIYLGIYWNNHHHMLQATTRVNGAVLWANLNLLFWLSLVPFTTRWIGENHRAPVPTAAYGLVLLLAALSYTILQGRIIAVEGERSTLATAVQRDVKGKVSLACYVAAIPLAWVDPWIADGLFVIVALIWLVPDRRIETELAGH